MVGEIRDRETAQIAVQAALTGHLVLSTLHTNSAAAAVTRLRDMGVEDYLLDRGAARRPGAAPGAPAVPRMPPARARPRRELVRRFDLDRRCDGGPSRCCITPVGCPACRQTGYRGRAADRRVPGTRAEIERLIFAGADHATIERAAVARRHGDRCSTPAWRRRWPARRRSRKCRAASGRRLSHDDVPLHARSAPAGDVQRGTDGRGDRGRGDRPPAAPGQHADARRTGRPAAPGSAALLHGRSRRRRRGLRQAGCRRLSSANWRPCCGAGQDLDRALRYHAGNRAATRACAPWSAACATRCATAARCRSRWRATRRSFPGCMSAWCAPARPAAIWRRPWRGIADLLDRQRAWPRPSPRR